MQLTSRGGVTWAAGRYRIPAIDQVSETLYQVPIWGNGYLSGLTAGAHALKLDSAERPDG